MKKKQPNNFIRFSGMAITMGVVIFLGVFGGMKLDERMGNKTPWFTLLGAILGVVIAIYNVIRDLTRNR